MARGTNEAPSDVTPESEVSGQANPMAEPSANPTEAQQAQAESSSNSDGPSEDAIKQAREDQRKRDEDQTKAVTREANPNLGGESFGYLKRD